MANTKISALPSVVTPASTDQFAVNQGGTSKKMTLQQIAGAAGNFNPEGTSRIQRNSTTEIQLNIGSIPLLVSSIWQNRAVTAAVTLSNGGLSANTVYRIYAFDSAGTLTLEAVTTAHATDATYGVEIKSGDSTRTLVGMVRTNASSQFQDDNTLLGVISWFNRRNKSIRNNFTANRSVTSTGYTEFNSEIRANLITWGDDAVILSVNGGVTNDTASGASALGLSDEDSTTTAFSHTGLQTSAGSVPLFPFGIGGAKVVAEGFHFFTLLGYNNAAQLTLVGAALAGAVTAATLHATVRG